MESLEERNLRMTQARDESIARREAPTGLRPGMTQETPVQEPTPVTNPIESACYDALIYFREGLTRQEVLQFILLRNRISHADAERILDQVEGITDVKPANESDD